jgi:hypothetical protein
VRPTPAVTNWVMPTNPVMDDYLPTHFIVIRDNVIKQQRRKCEITFGTFYYYNNFVVVVVVIVEKS